jgi:glycosyltransferase involved in cell wall biosynthesis
LRVHVLYEYGADCRPHGSAFLRLIRPLGHPAIADRVSATFDTDYVGAPVDVVIVDRLWRPDVTLERARQLVDAVRAAGAALVYALDDNLLDLRQERLDWPTEEQEAVVRLWLAEADGVLATTPALVERFTEFNTNGAVLANMLDERLLVRRPPGPAPRPFGSPPITIGYMGTYTHDADLAMIAPALREVSRRRPGAVRVDLVGVTGRPETTDLLEGVAVRILSSKPPEHEYGLFLPWFTSTVRWDIAVSPLRDTPFTRGKSDVKFLDYAAVGAAPVVSRHVAYTDSVQDRYTGLLVDDDPGDWTDALDLLIDDDRLRSHLADAATRYLFGHRVLARTADRWPAALAELLARSPRRTS